MPMNLCTDGNRFRMTEAPTWNTTLLSTSGTVQSHMFCKTCNDILDAGTSGTFGWRRRRPRNARCPSRTSFLAPGASRIFPPVLLSCFQHSCSLHPGTSSGSRLRTLMASATKARSPIRLMSTNQLLVSQHESPRITLSHLESSYLRHTWIYLMWTNQLLVSLPESSWVILVSHSWSYLMWTNQFLASQPESSLVISSQAESD